MKADVLLARARAFTAALTGGGDAKARTRALGQQANALLSAFAGAKPTSIATAIAVLDEALRAAATDADRELVRLVLGAAVESGVAPEVVWPAARRGFVEAAKSAGRKGAARSSLRSRAILALACLLRSEDLRVSVQESEPELIAACAPFAEDIEEMGFVGQVAQILPASTLLVLAPEQRRGARVRMHEVTDNTELYVLLADALVGPGRAMKGRRPSKEATRVATDPDHDAPEPVPVVVAFELADWRGRAIDLRGVPRGIPMHRGERVVLLATRDEPQADLAIEGAFDPLRPRVEVTATLSAADVDRQLLALQKAAALAEAAEPSTSTAPAGAGRRAEAGEPSARSPAGRS